MTATRLGRGLIPLTILFATGSVGVIRSSPEGWLTCLGAAAASASMLAYGLRVVQRAMGRRRRPWMRMASVGSVVPTLYGLYVVGWRGFRGLTLASGADAVVPAILFGVMGVWVLLTWMRVVEVRRLARVMVSNLDGDGQSA